MECCIRTIVSMRLKITLVQNISSIFTLTLVTTVFPSMRAAMSTTRMKPLTSTASTMLRLCPRQRLSALPLTTLSGQRRTKADMIQTAAGEYDRTSTSHISPFANQGAAPSTKIPSFAKYMSKKGETSNKTFQYFMVGTMGLLAAAGAKATVQGKQLD